MVIGTVTSTNGVSIRLTKERWAHIITSHLEINPKTNKWILMVVKNPDVILEGDFGELLAVKKKPRSKTYLVVPYKEVNSKDGFILTAYLTTDTKRLFKRKVIWSKE